MTRVNEHVFRSAPSATFSTLAEGNDRPAFSIPPEHILLSLEELYPITKMKRTSTYAAIKKDGFPEPIHLGQRLVAWRLSEVLAWVESRPRGTRPVARKGVSQ